MRVARTGTDYESTTAKVLALATATKYSYDDAINAISGWSPGNVVLGAVAQKMKKVDSDKPNFGEKIGNLLQKQPSVEPALVEKGPFNVVGIRKFSNSKTGTNWQQITRGNYKTCSEIIAVIPMSEITNWNGNTDTSKMCTDCIKGRFQADDDKAYTNYGNKATLCTECPQAKCVEERQRKRTSARSGGKRDRERVRERKC